MPESLRPGFGMTIFTSGVWEISARIAEAVSADFASEIPGARLARIQMTPSSSCGRNSAPTRVESRPAPATAAKPSATTSRARRMGLPMSRS